MLATFAPRQAMPAPGLLAAGLRWALFGMAALLAWRRLAGAFDRPTEGWLACTVVAIALAAGALSRELALGIIAGGTIRGGARALAWRWAPTAGIAGIAWGVAPPLAGNWQAPAAWLVAIAGELAMQIAWLKRARSGFPRPDSPTPTLRRQTRPASQTDICQKLTRRTLPSGQEEIVGVLRMGISAGQRHAVAHAAFCPPFAGVPTVACDVRDALGRACGAATAVQALPHGARFDIKLAAGAPAACFVWLDYTASAAGSSSA